MTLSSARTTAKNSAFNNWLHNSMSRESVLSGLKTFVWLAPLTVLIWIYAEREQELQLDNIPIPIDVQSDDRNRFVSLQMEDKNIITQLRGSRSRLDALRQAISPRAGEPSVIIPIDPRLDPGRSYDIDTAQLLAHSRVFQYSGVTIGETKPARLKIFVDDFEEREFEVQTPPGVTNLVGTPVFNPAKITVRAPRSYFAEADKRGPLKAEAKLPTTGVLDKPGPFEGMVSVAVTGLKLDKNVTYSAATVNASLVVRPSDTTRTIDSVSVFVTGPIYLLARYKVVCNDTVPNVPVVGPPDQIAIIMENKPTAVLEVSKDDANGQEIRKRLDFKFPRGAENVKVPDNFNRDFVYKLVEQSAEH